MSFFRMAGGGCDDVEVDGVKGWSDDEDIGLDYLYLIDDKAIKQTNKQQQILCKEVIWYFCFSFETLSPLVGNQRTSTDFSCM